VFRFPGAHAFTHHPHPCRCEHKLPPKTDWYVDVQVIQTLKEVRDEASNLYVDLQSALLRASVKHYLTSDGTLWDSMPLKKELRDATYEMAFALVLIVNQILSHATPSVQTVRTFCLPVYL
jgi:hypothetical protein